MALCTINYGMVFCLICKEISWPNFESFVKVRNLDNLKKFYGIGPVWPDLAKIHHFSKNWEISSNILKVYFVFGKVVNPLWEYLNTFGQSFIVENGQILKNQFGYLVTLNRPKVKHKKFCYVSLAYQISRSRYIIGSVKFYRVGHSSSTGAH